ncbi:MAG TPA: hypothetical protein VN969_21900 [Streptosporangiaceae bacterium]|nr:hypothetical protein [Streptosporangiaceae bacterium]
MNRARTSADAIASDYLSRLKRALAPLPRGRRGQILDDVAEHVAAARGALADQSDGTSVREILDRLGAPEDIAAEALADAPSQRIRRQLRTHRRAVGATTAVLIVGSVVAGMLTSGSPQPAAAQTTAVVVPDDTSDCAPQSPATSGPAATLTSKATEVTSGTVDGSAWSLWSAAGKHGATGLEDGGLVIDGHAYGLCPGFPNPAELEMADVGPTAIVYGVVGYPRRANVQLYTSTVGTFDRGRPLPAPNVRVVQGVSFFIGALPRSACDYPALELNTTSPGVSAEHNLGFGSCKAGNLVPITASQGIWQQPPGSFPASFPGIANVPGANSGCSPQSPVTSTAAATLTSHAVKVASGIIDGSGWSLWSADGKSGATGLEDGGLVIDGRAYGLCPGYPNPAELELADIGPAAIVYGVVGYHGLAKVQLYNSTVGTFDRGQPLPGPGVQVVRGVSFFIGTLPRSACDYPALELNTTSPGVSAEHNLGFGSCAADNLVPITASQGIWQLPPGSFPADFPGGGGGSGPSSPPDSDCSPTTNAATSGGPAADVTTHATEVASGTVAGHAWSLWSARGQHGANGLEDGGLILGGHAYGLCPGFPNPAELELADVGHAAIVYGVIGYPGRATVHLYTGSSQSFTTGAALPAPSVRAVSGVSFFIGTLPRSACDYPWLELNSAVKSGSSQHNLGFGTCTANRLVPITSSMGQWTING